MDKSTVGKNRSQSLSELSRIIRTLKTIIDKAIASRTTNARDKAALQDAGDSAAHSLMLLKTWFGAEFLDKPASVNGFDRVISDLVIATFDIAARTSYTESIVSGITARQMNQVRSKKKEVMERRRAAILEVAKEKHLTLATSEKFARQIEPYLRKIGFKASLATIKSDIAALKQESKKKG